MNWPDLLGRPMPTPTAKIAYGPGPLEFGELWLPGGRGRHPTVLMIHGGCWRSGVAKLSIMNYVADDLRRRGYAVWNIEYPGIDRPGGGYPGTFQAVAAATDKLEDLARDYPLDIGRVVALGHSAGGHLAFWVAARPNVPTWSQLRAAHPLRIAAVLSLGGLPDLNAVEALGDQSCGADTVHRLIGAPDPARSDVYADTSPPELGHASARAVLINGDDDTIAPPDMGRAYAAKMTDRGEHIRAIVLPDTGHVELIAPGTPAWAKAVDSLAALMRER